MAKKRITKVTTKTGDEGTTGMADGSRQIKSHNIINAIGDIDELNSWIGKLISLDETKTDRFILIDIQHCLFAIGGSLSLRSEGSITEDDIDAIEIPLNSYNLKLKELTNFILPGGHQRAADIHIARAVCRRCERSMVKLRKSNDVDKRSLVYINRLSDFLFVLARTVNLREGVKEIIWNQKN